MPSTVATYTNIPGRSGGLLSINRNGQSFYPLPDMQGHIRQLTNASGNVTDTLTPTAFGVQKAATGSTPNPYKSFGQWGYFTESPSRQYVQARHLRVDLGRWLSKDPLAGEIVALSQYLYACNSPLSLFDPNGMKCAYPNDHSKERNWTLAESGNDVGDARKYARAGCHCASCCFHDLTSKNEKSVRDALNNSIAKIPTKLSKSEKAAIVAALLCIAKKESQLDPEASQWECNEDPGMGASSSATGIFQHLNARWAEAVKHGSEVGITIELHKRCDITENTEAAIVLIHSVCSEAKFKNGPVSKALQQEWEAASKCKTEVGNIPASATCKKMLNLG
jgi:RHS repeat-associated protein